jgi:hypothetical protein
VPEGDSGSPVATSCIIGPISGSISEKNVWKLASSGHSSITITFPSEP